MGEMGMIPYSCLNCHKELIENDREVFCPECECSWRKEQNIPNFLEKKLHWGNVSQEELKRINDYIGTYGWEAGLKKFREFREISQAQYAVASYKREINWINLIPPEKESSALDIGCGFGGITFALAQKYKEVYCLDAAWETVRFVNLRKENVRAKNVIPFCATMDKIPFSKPLFDLAVMNGTLEWAAFLIQEGKPTAVQQELLKKVYSILRPGGILYIGIENRFNIGFILGQIDHGGTRFTSIMPRRMADICSRLICARPYRTYTYSRRGYIDLLQRANFREVNFYMAFPSYRDADVIIALKDIDRLREFMKTRRNAKRFLPHILLTHNLFLKAYTAIAPNFIIIAQK